MAKAKKIKIEDQQIVRTNIERITLIRLQQDIQRWRYSLRMAENRERPDRVQLYTIYRECMDDDQVIAVTRKIIFRCTNSKIWWKVDGQRADMNHPLNMLARKSYFAKLVQYILESVWWGHSLIQLNFLEPNFNPMTDEAVELVHRPNVRPEYGDILVKQGQEKDAIEFRKQPFANFLLEAGERRNLGLLNPSAPVVLAKRQGFVNWTEFLEVYGMPIPAIEYDPNIPSNRTEAEKMLREKGSNFGVIYPKGSNFQLHDSAKAGNSQAFLDKLMYHDGSISKIFLLQTMTTDDGGSRSQGEVHQKGEDEAVWAYQTIVENILNEKLVELLKLHGWQVEENGGFAYGDTERLKKAALADIIAKVSAVADIPMSYVYETFNIPEPGPDDKIAQNIPVTTQQPDIQSGADKKKMSSAPRGPGRQLVIPFDAPCCGADHPKLSYDNTPLTNEEADILKKTWEGLLSNGKVPRAHFRQLSSLLTSGINEGFPEPAEDWDSPDHLRRSLLEANVQRFAGAKDLAMVQQLNEIKARVDSFEAFRQEAQPLLGKYNAAWLEAEYNHAVSASQNAANYLRQLDQAEDFPFWRYETVGDDRVRDAHANLDGKVFRLDDAEALRFYPPNGFNCRCEAIPTDEGDPETIEDAINAVGGEQWATMLKKGFDHNPGDTLKVFQRGMEYLQGFDPNALSHKNFLLLPYTDMTALPRINAKPLLSKAARDWFETRQGRHGLDSTGQIRLLDYRSRPILMTENTVGDLVTKAQGYLLNDVETALEKPDEVWMEEGNALIRRHVKFYEGSALVIDVIFSKGNLEKIKSVNLVEDNSGQAIDILRRGLLAYSKR